MKRTGIISIISVLLLLVLTGCETKQSNVELESLAVIEQSKIAEENLEAVRAERREIENQRAALESLLAESEAAEAETAPKEKLYNEEFLEEAELEGRLITNDTSRIDKDTKVLTWFLVKGIRVIISDASTVDQFIGLSGMTLVNPDVVIPSKNYGTLYYTNANGDVIEAQYYNYTDSEKAYKECPLKRFRIIYSDYATLDDTPRLLDEALYLGALNRLSSGSDCIKNGTLAGMCEEYARDGSGFSVENSSVKVTLKSKGTYGFLWGTSALYNTLGEIDIEFKDLENLVEETTEELNEEASEGELDVEAEGEAEGEVAEENKEPLEEDTKDEEEPTSEKSNVDDVADENVENSSEDIEETEETESETVKTPKTKKSN